MGLPGATTAMVSPGRRAGGFRGVFRENYYTVQTRFRANSAGSRRKSRTARNTPPESFLGSRMAENVPSRALAARSVSPLVSGYFGAARYPLSRRGCIIHHLARYLSRRMGILHNKVDTTRFNKEAQLPYELRLEDFQLAMQDIYDFFHDVNRGLVRRGLKRLDDMLRPAIMSGFLSDMLTASLAKHSRSLTVNAYHNGHPDLIVSGVYPGDSVQSGKEGIEIKTTRKAGGAADTHGARDQWMCAFVYEVDTKSEPARDRGPMTFTEVYLAKVEKSDFRNNARGALGTRTSTLHKDGIQKLRKNWIYRLSS